MKVYGLMVLEGVSPIRVWELGVDEYRPDSLHEPERAPAHAFCNSVHEERLVTPRAKACPSPKASWVKLIWWRKKLLKGHRASDIERDGGKHDEWIGDA